jgi:hypothetical protein
MRQVALCLALGLTGCGGSDSAPPTDPAVFQADPETPETPCDVEYRGCLEKAVRHERKKQQPEVDKCVHKRETCAD